MQLTVKATSRMKPGITYAYFRDDIEKNGEESLFNRLRKGGEVSVDVDAWFDADEKLLDGKEFEQDKKTYFLWMNPGLVEVKAKVTATKAVPETRGKMGL